MATLPQIFGKNFVFSQKQFVELHRFLGECFAARVFTGYSFNDPVQKCLQLRQNLSGSVWGCSPVLLQYKTKNKIK
jgi:hypothetical protein